MKWPTCYSFLIILFMLSCARWQPAGMDGKMVSISSTGASDTSVISALAPYKIKVDSNMDIRLVQNGLLMKKEQPESALGNMMADVMFRYADKVGLKPDLAITNYGGIRMNYLDKGILTYRDAFQLMPFDNRIVMLVIPGHMLYQWFSHMASKGGWPVSNAKYRISSERTLIGPVSIGGRQLDTSLFYRVATTDYLATGGDHCDFLKGLTFSDTGYLLRDAIIDYWNELGEKGELLMVEKEGRVIYGE